VRVLPGELAANDELLDDELFFTPFTGYIQSLGADVGHPSLVGYQQPVPHRGGEPAFPTIEQRMQCSRR
jgi:hypothetical protein